MILLHKAFHLYGCSTGAGLAGAPRIGEQYKERWILEQIAEVETWENWIRQLVHILCEHFNGVLDI
jgi:hypothetical protein